MASDKEVAMIMSLTGVDEVTASEAYLQTECVEDAVDRLLQKPAVSGDRYIPPKPKVKTGMTTEQEERCKRGRWLQDQVNVVFSVAHSKTRIQPDPLVLVEESTPSASAVSVPALTDESQPDAGEKTTPSTQQSEGPR